MSTLSASWITIIQSDQILRTADHSAPQQFWCGARWGGQRGKTAVVMFACCHGYDCFVRNGGNMFTCVEDSYY